MPDCTVFAGLFRSCTKQLLQLIFMDSIGNVHAKCPAQNNCKRPGKVICSVFGADRPKIPEKIKVFIWPGVNNCYLCVPFKEKEHFNINQKQ